MSPSLRRSRPSSRIRTVAVGVVGALVGSVVTVSLVGSPAIGTAPPALPQVVTPAPADVGDPAPDPGPATPADGADPAKPLLTAGALWHPWSPGPGELGCCPMALSFDHVRDDGRTAKSVLASWGRNEDSPTAPPRNTRAIGENNGQIFTPYTALPAEHAMVASTRLRSGTLLTASFVPVSSPAPNRFGILMASSTDAAKSWQNWTAPITEDKWKLGWYRIHRDLIELADGTLLLGGYGKGAIDGVTKEYSLIFESTDGGKSFRQRSAVNAGSSYSTNELGFGRTADGRLVAVMRGTESVPRPPSMPLTQTFSADDGRTWEPVKPFVPPAGMPNNGIMPQPVLQPNGQLLLSYGRPDNNVVVSLDGTGRTWDAGKTVYSRYPGENSTRRWMGSSGNMALVNRDASSSLAFGDSCHNIWYCREYSHDNKIWTRVVDARGPGQGRLDLMTKALAGTVKVTAAGLAASSAAYPEQRALGAIDGSGEYRAAARFAGKGKLTVELDRVYTLNRIGLMLGKGERNSANIQVSVDGRAWGKPVLKTGARTDWAMRYTDIEPVEAKFVRIVPGDEAPLTAVTELELFAKYLMTFENDAIGTIPRGVTNARYALTADKGEVVPYQHSRTRIALQDNDEIAKAQATFHAQEPSATQRLSFGYEGYGYGSGAIWDIRGTDASGQAVTVYRLHLAPDWSANKMVVRVWDGSAWTQVGGLGPVPPNRTAWMSFQIDSTASETTVSMNGTVLGRTTATLAQATTFTGFSAETGLRGQDVGNMEHSYDDIEIRPLSTG